MKLLLLNSFFVVIGKMALLLSHCSYNFRAVRIKRLWWIKNLGNLYGISLIYRMPPDRPHARMMVPSNPFKKTPWGHLRERSQY